MQCAWWLSDTDVQFVVMDSLVSRHSGVVKMSFLWCDGGDMNEVMKVFGKPRPLKFVLYKKWYMSNGMKRYVVEFLKIFRDRK